MLPRKIQRCEIKEEQVMIQFQQSLIAGANACFAVLGFFLCGLGVLCALSLVCAVIGGVAELFKKIGKED